MREGWKEVGRDRRRETEVRRGGRKGVSECKVRS